MVSIDGGHLRHVMVPLLMEGHRASSRTAPGLEHAPRTVRVLGVVGDYRLGGGAGSPPNTTGCVVKVVVHARHFAAPSVRCSSSCFTTHSPSWLYRLVALHLHHQFAIPAVRRLPVITMKNSSLISLVLLLAASPLAAAWSDVWCGSDGTYSANSTYETNLRRLAAVFPAEAASALRGRYVHKRALGYWPNRLQATSTCRSHDGDCADCIADAFKEVERACPYRKKAYFDSTNNCFLQLGDVHILGSDGIFGGNELIQTLAWVMIFQAIGLGYLFFLFLQAWRDSKKGTVMHYTHLPSGDQ
ncbi:uncharacterized protein LOC133890326 [Phragmites australis]|uniref:uncharacterized protein LOC133890326 n=1 Tax=Phragmites australis TaxID=29695 RepID=UPI002D783FC6|nr:uncharacterized protein LOC133890326 [Phragmites australis]